MLRGWLWPTSCQLTGLSALCGRLLPCRGEALPSLQRNPGCVPVSAGWSMSDVYFIFMRGSGEVKAVAVAVVPEWRPSLDLYINIFLKLNKVAFHAIVSQCIENSLTHLLYRKQPERWKRFFRGVIIICKTAQKIEVAKRKIFAAVSDLTLT